MTIGRIAILVAAMAAALPGAALAQSTYTWSGVYVGVQAGYGWGTTATGVTHMYEDTGGTVEFGDSPLPPFSYSSAGLMGGVEAGYNWQSGSMVLGLVGDIAAANIRGNFVGSTAFSVDSTINWLGTARVNLGAAFGNSLIYGTGGVAFGGITAGLHDDYGIDGIIDSSATTTNVGWTIGGGIATAINTNWILKAEYLYVDLGSKDLSFSEPNPPGFGLITTSARSTASIAKVSLDYKF